MARPKGGAFPPDMKAYIEERAYILRVRHGMTLKAITEKIRDEIELPPGLVLSLATVHNAIVKRREYQSAELEALKVKVLADIYEQITYIYAESMTAWEKSKEPTRKVIQKSSLKALESGQAKKGRGKVQDAEATPQLDELTTEIIERLPDPRYLEVALDSIQFAAKAFGIGEENGTPQGVQRYEVQVIRTKLDKVRDNAR